MSPPIPRGASPKPGVNITRCARAGLECRDDRNEQRLFDPMDLVRVEIEAARQEVFQ
jgi:hypothetical protein